MLLRLRSIFLVALVLFASRLPGSEFNDDIIVAWTEGSHQSGFPVKETVFHWLESVVGQSGLTVGLLEEEVSENGFRDFNAEGRELGAVFLVTAWCDVQGSTVMLEIDPVQVYEDTSLIRDMEHFSRPAESMSFDVELLQTDSEAPGFINFFGYFTISGVFYARGDYQTALQEVDKALEYLDEVPPETAATGYMMSSMIRMGMQDGPGAINDLEKALDLNPLFVRAHMSIGMLYYYTGNTPEAMLRYSGAIEVDSSYYKPYLLRADLSMAQGMYEEALEDYTRALQLYPGDAATHFTVGILMYQREEYEPGIEHFSSAIRFDSSMADAYYGRGLCFMETGNTEQAVEDLETVLTLCSDPARRNMAEQQLELLED